MATTADKQQMWVDWTHDAMATYVSPDNAKDDNEDLVDDMAEVATMYADAMLEEFEGRFGSGTKRKRSRKSEEEEED